MAVAAFALVSCNSEVIAEPTEPAVTDELVEVLRVTKDITAGTKLTDADVEVVSIRKNDVAINTITKKDDVVGKYATTNLYKGDFLFPAKLSATQPVVEDDSNHKTPADFELAYTLITEYDSLVKDGDYTEAIAKAIEENPGATIYFPDGDYAISDTVVISGDAALGVSFRLSNYATIKAVDWTDKTKPMIRLGVATENGAQENIFSERNTYVMGGVIDAAGVATGIVIEGGWNITLSNLTVKNSFCGIHLKDAVKDACADIENVNVVGSGEAGSIGVLVDGSRNTITNMKISDAQYALKCGVTASDNVFKSVMAIGTGLGSSKDNAGFWDTSAGNQYDICYSDQYATGFLLEENCRSTFNACVVSWWSAENDYHVGFRAVGKLNATILYSKVVHDDTVATDAYLLVGADGGEGSVQYPIKQIVSTEYDAVLNKYCATDILD
jgi:hypothetical protein